MMPIAEIKSYGNSLANMGFTHHNIIRFRRYDPYIAKGSIVNDISSDKLNFKQVDWYLNNPSWLSGVTSGSYREYYKNQYLQI